MEMKKLLFTMLLMLGMSASAQTFDFSCGPVPGSLGEAAAEGANITLSCGQVLQWNEMHLFWRVSEKIVIDLYDINGSGVYDDGVKTASVTEDTLIASLTTDIVACTPPVMTGPIEQCLLDNPNQYIALPVVGGLQRYIRYLTENTSAPGFRLHTTMSSTSSVGAASSADWNTFVGNLENMGYTLEGFVCPE